MNADARSNPVICAVDTTDLKRAISLVSGLKGVVGAVKLGLEFFTAHGPHGVRQVRDAGLPVFLDLKYHDIPNTVAGAVKAAVALDVFMLTVHAGGGRDMLETAVQVADEEAKKKGGKRPLIVGVTVLTSLDSDDLLEVGVDDGAGGQVMRLATLAKQSGLDGVVCSPHECKKMREHFGEEFVLVVPGIRPQGSEKGDQKRVTGPKEAMRDGASFIVVGRPITQAENPVIMARNIVDNSM